jgi:enoyl-CoA hydratase/carnithine racemase
MTAELLLTRDNAVATLTLNRPGKHNALTAAMWEQLAARLRALSDDEGVRCVILTGAGGQAFSAGADIAEFASVRSDVAQARSYGARIAAAIGAIEACRHPVVAAIRGLCVGGGLELAAACDLRIAGAGARFGIPVGRLGLVVAYAELRPLLRLVGPAYAKELLFEGNLYDAAAAQRMGLLNRVVPDAEVEREARATAQRIAEGAPLVARWHKRFVGRLLEGTPLSETETDESFRCFATDDYRIGREAFLAKRVPRFSGR